MSLKDLQRRHVLLVEDNEADAMLTRLVHDEVKHCSWLQIANSGKQALQYLRDETKFAERGRPEIVMMDMSLPAQSGLELINEIRALPGCEFLPIVMISGSENPAEVRRAYELGANCVIKKSSSWEEYFRKLESCYEFWCLVVELPK